MPETPPRGLVDPEAIVSTYEIGERLGVDPTTIWHWAQEADFPPPIRRVGKGGRFQLWVWPDVAKWAILHGVIRGRPPAPASDSVADELLTGRQVADRLGWTSSGTAWQLAQNGTFPWPVREQRPRMWRASDVDEWESTARRQPSRRKGTT